VWPPRAVLVVAKSQDLLPSSQIAQPSKDNQAELTKPS
jgi:hypothetical protein